MSGCCNPPSNCPKKYLTGTLCQPTTTLASVYADHSPSREAYGVINFGATAGDLQGGKYSNLSAEFAHKNILCANYDAQNFIVTIQFAKNTFVCSALGSTAGSTAGRDNYGLPIITFNGELLFDSGQFQYRLEWNDDRTYLKISPFNTHNNIRYIHVIQPKQACGDEMRGRVYDTDNKTLKLEKNMCVNTTSPVSSNCPPCCPP